MKCTLSFMCCWKPMQNSGQTTGNIGWTPKVGRPAHLPQSRHPCRIPDGTSMSTLSHDNHLRLQVFPTPESTLTHLTSSQSFHSFGRKVVSTKLSGSLAAQPTRSPQSLHSHTRAISKMSSAEGLQIAQIIADLQTLQNAVRPLFPS